MARTLATLMLLASCPVLLANGCKVLPQLRFLDPVEGAEVTWMPLRIRLDFQHTARLETFEARLNGIDITPHFALVPAPAEGERGFADADFVWDGLVLPGANLLEASIQTRSGLQTASAAFSAVGDPYADDCLVPDANRSCSPTISSIGSRSIRNGR